MVKPPAFQAGDRGFEPRPEYVKLAFGDIVVVDRDKIGVVVKCWSSGTVEVYVRVHNGIVELPVDQVERYLVRHKLLNEEELGYQAEAVRMP